MHPTTDEHDPSRRRLRPYSPPGLEVIRGPGDRYGKGSRWMVADAHGLASVELMRDEHALQPETMYIERLEIKLEDRRRGHGKELLRKIELFAMNLGAEWLQIDSEAEAAGFWRMMGFQETGKLIYAGKVSMVKRLGRA